MGERSLLTWQRIAECNAVCMIPDSADIPTLDYATRMAIGNMTVLFLWWLVPHVYGWCEQRDAHRGWVFTKSFAVEICCYDVYLLLQRLVFFCYCYSVQWLFLLCSFWILMRICVIRGVYFFRFFLPLFFFFPGHLFCIMFIDDSNF